MSPPGFQFAIDRGGTFTDVFARCPNGKVRVMKLLSVDPQNYDDAPREAIRRILQEETGNALDKDGKVKTSLIESIRMGTTVATNALLERKGAIMALVINKGFKDLLLIGNQARPNIFQLDIKRPDVLYSDVIEVDCRVIPAMDDRCQLGDIKSKWRQVTGITGEKMLVMKELDEDAVRRDLARLREKGIESVAVVLAHSYTYHEHEVRIGKIAEEIGFPLVSLSHAVTAMVRLAPRGYTAAADAYLTPHIQHYVRGFARGFTDELKGTNVLFMQSDGGLTPMDLFNGSRAILSGPAGGVVGYAMTAYQEETGLPVIGFDMGGTSTDVSRYAGALEHVHEATTAGVTIQAPQLDINTVAAGGGSMLTFRSGLFAAGPESASAHPGPACYRKGGPLTVTDANLLLGRLLPEYFPKIFGPNENEPLDKEATITAFKKMTNEINSFLKADGGKEMTMEEVAMGFLNVANEAMCRPINALTTARGHDASRHALACFGGAGGQHACSVARTLGVTTVLLHKYAGILSAYGMALAHVVHEAQQPSGCVYAPDNFQEIDRQLEVLAAVCKDKLRKQGFSDARIQTEPYLHLRYTGTDCALMVSPVASDTATRHGDFYRPFVTRYQNEFGFTLADRDVIVDDIRVRGVGLSEVARETEPPSGKGIKPVPEKTVKVYFDGGYQDTAVYLLEKLMPEQELPGPAIIMDSLSTVLVEPDCRAEITKLGDIKITIGSGKPKRITTELEPIQLSIFSHRFMSIAEQMGRVLQRTSISVNIKERLDFSCALFGPDGGLVSNAPHIPVHLGAMQEAVQYQMKIRGDSLKPGDVLLANHPKAGGSHLPDLTVITSVFHNDRGRPIFFVASRGHHADIGGLTPGSMPPHSTYLKQEGAAFKSFLLVDGGKFNEKELTAELMKPGEEEGCSGTRNLADNLSDLKAQVAANQRGIQLVGELINHYGLDVVQAYMAHIQKNAEIAVRDMLKEIAKKTYEKTGSTVLKAVEYMDNGTPIALSVTIDKQSGTALCDFTGTGVEVWGNLNSPRAITLSALIYCLRCMVGHDVPLNQGCLNPVQVVIPPGSILDPSEGAAVVGGNVLTSQRIVDVVLKAFQVCAGSQGCMNNLTLGEDSWGYYETVAGGSGAGPGWHGCGGVHTHMTNTRITDVEIVERRYPMLVEQFALRDNSGGKGKWRGGDGTRRVLVMRRPVRLSVLTERRAFQPYGMQGGEPGERGLNLLQRVDGRIINLGGKASVEAFPGDKYIMNSPAGGGYGPPSELPPTASGAEQHSGFLERGSLFEYRSAQESVVLQRTSISVNIKERLDFSCALFGPDGGLVSNAPHIPVHLGAMQEAVQYQMKIRGDSLKPGDVLLANHPKAGGSHLPDLTVITPVFHNDRGRPIFFVASRGHHADIGGLTPGSMPPHSTYLKQEGAAFKSFLLVDGGKFNEKELTAELMKPGEEEGCSGTRNLADNLSDLKAQVAANQRGIQLVGELINHYGLDVVQAYMAHIQKNAEIAVRDMLKEIAKKTYEKTGSTVLKAVEYMDNGTPIALSVTIDKQSGTALCDFTGTGVEVWGNLNSPRAITLSALIYCLRCMVGHDVPLNQGCLNPVQVVIPPGSILDPSEGAAVVGGNVLTSQRIVDVVLKAFQVCAGSQGCMNNLTLGEDSWGYYETVAGGSGAGPGWHGCGGVHTHMTNTRITDVEIVERRYPMLVEQFALRDNSGGKGQWRGGDGTRRVLVMRRPVRLSVLTERRAFQPYGMQGGEPGERGLNLLQRVDGRIINLGGKASVEAFPGDKYIMNSPAGGGYGPPSELPPTASGAEQRSGFLERGSLFEYRSAQESV